MSTKKAARPPNLLALLHELRDDLEKRMHLALDEAGFEDVRPAHGPVFGAIGADGSRVTDMARRAGMTKQSMSELVEYLEERGYVERAPDPEDRRAQKVRLTKLGWRTVDVAIEAVDAVEREWASVIGERGMRAFRSRLEKLVQLS
jgi:DNA-binding MarR family transcriptional regulator